MRKLLFDPTKEENEYSIWKSTKVYTAFLFIWASHFEKRSLKTE